MEQNRALPELLSPAGDMEKLKMAVAYGADAVYLAGNEFGMRAATGNFSDDEIKTAIEYCKARGVKVYVTLNIVAKNYETEQMGRYAAALHNLGADAAIISDLGVFAAVKRHAPELELHVSTQAGVANYESANLWHSMGAKRVILARELSLEEIREIRGKTPASLELECFVHGAMCMSFSGRCLISDYMTATWSPAGGEVTRSANRGACVQPCRWKYFLREEKREGEYFEIEEHPEGSYFFNSYDLCAVSFLDKIIAAGVSSLKIEGRGKSSYYAAAATNAYRGALRDFAADRPYDPKWYDELCKVSHRRYCPGFFMGGTQAKDREPIQHYNDSSYMREWDVCAFVEAGEGDEGRSLLLQKNRFKEGEEVELMLPDGGITSFTVGAIYEAGERVTEAIHPHGLYETRLPVRAPQFSIIRKRI